MTTLSKCLAVATAVASLVFLGFAMISTAGGPNWSGEMHELDTFVFEQSAGENPTWSVQWRQSEETVPLSGESAQVAAAALVAAREALDQSQKDRLDELDQRIAATKAQIEEAKAFIESDLRAIDTRIQQLDTELTDLQRQISQQTEEGNRLAEEIRTVQDDTQQRVQESFRLRAQLQELRTDKYRALAQKKELESLLLLVQGSIERLHRRNQRLKQRVYD